MNTMIEQITDSRDFIPLPHCPLPNYEILSPSELEEALDEVESLFKESAYDGIERLFKEAIGEAEDSFGMEFI